MGCKFLDLVMRPAETACEKAARTGKPVYLGHTVVNPPATGIRPAPPPAPPKRL